MSATKRIAFVLASLFAIVLSLCMPGPALAEQDTPETPSNCIVCHENLYYLHDTGKYFCVNEASQRCVDCHGGDPTATDKESAHFDRSAHPVVNGDISKCQECHPSDCEEFVHKFEQVAGINPVMLAAKPILLEARPADVPIPPNSQQPPATWALFLPIMAGGALIIIALAAFIAHLRHTG
jgi:hypothetical protein